MKNLVTGLMVVSLVAAAGLAEARGKAGDPSSRSNPSGASSSGESQYGSQGADMTGTTGKIGSQAKVSGADARQLIRDWPQVSQQAAQSMLDRYGQPDVVSGSLLVWNEKTPFTKITVTRDGIRHLFPMEHQDVLTEEINLAVPLDKVEDLARFDGSLLVDRTKGTVAARSDSEASNFLALNLADDIINGKRDVAGARKFYSDTLAKQMSGKSSMYTDKLNFSVSGDTSAPDTGVSPSHSDMSPSGSSGSPSSVPNSGAPDSSPNGAGTPTEGQ